MTAAQVALHACRALRSHGLRTALAATGVLAGVATIVAALAVGEGARQRAYADVSALGMDNVFLKSRALREGYPAPARFTPADVRAVAERSGDSSTVAAARRDRGHLQRGSTSLPAEIAGVTVSWQTVAAARVAAGRWLDTADVLDRRRVVVLSAALAHGLFGERDPVGEHVRWRGQPFRVVGVLEPSRRAAADASAFVPVTAADTRLGPSDDVRNVQEIAVVAGEGVNAELVARRAREALAARGHREGSVETIVPRALLRARLEAQRTFDRVLFAVGLIALVISGIGIMNVMLASVSDRITEIGVCRAVGASRRDVLAQFGAEALLVALAGVAGGVPLGILSALALATRGGWPMAVTGATVLLAAGAATLVGLGAAVYPAWRAAAVDPASALRG